ncbi:hypothetical protein KEM48_002673 [Puccinia striiformis f. sp. tritici PST-130]|uniref:Uncharacterized protein n=1 Tax=Puccinia striiformis f. sp. tritici PST-78 TaxID=1165861 RepID=A0A0L0V349_9BASI|nr:hypothetical protein KEM48_002673 [Puccinia striiformis f. sp. tritici PST-130]KNE93707.1 hypothetical protein PSTG_12988 [Puccinia striiformis f. sp. tritici PST-78]
MGGLLVLGRLRHCGFCWNSIPSSNSRSLNPEPQTSKRPACHSVDDVSQNSIDQRLNSDLALPSEFSLDHQRSRSSNNNHLSPQDKDSKSSQSNKTIKSNLLDRITSTSQGKVIPLHYLS